MNRQQQEENIYNEQKYEIKKLSFDVFFKNQEIRQKEHEKKFGAKVDYEFQEIGVEMQKWFGINIWWIFSKPYARLDEVKRAFQICKEKNIKNIGYLVAILKN